jgi:hypothetical protein
LKRGSIRSFTAKPVLERFGEFSRYMAQEGGDARDIAALRLGEATCRPLGIAKWIAKTEQKTARMLSPQKRGPKLKET